MRAFHAYYNDRCGHAIRSDAWDRLPNNSIARLGTRQNTETWRKCEAQAQQITANGVRTAQHAGCSMHGNRRTTLHHVNAEEPQTFLRRLERRSCALSPPCKTGSNSTPWPKLHIRSKSAGVALVRLHKNSPSKTTYSYDGIEGPFFWRKQFVEIPSGAGDN